MSGSEGKYVVVGVVPRQPDAVLRHAAVLAARFDATLVCAAVDPGRYPIEELPDGRVRSAPFDPDYADLGAVPGMPRVPGEWSAGGLAGAAADGAERGPDAVDPALEAHLAEVLDPTGVPWEARALAGDPARALSRLAEVLDAALIVVGTHEGGLRGSLRELLSGSVAAHLAHRQHRPVVVIPLAPVGLDADLPWDTGS